MEETAFAAANAVANCTEETQLAAEATTTTTNREEQEKRTRLLSSTREALIQAATAGKFDAFRANLHLLEHGNNNEFRVNQIIKDGKNIVHYLTESDSCDCSSSSRSNNDDSNNDRNKSCCSAAAGKVAILSFLLQRAEGVDLTVPTSKGWTPLLLAASTGPLEIVKLLLSSNKNNNIKNIMKLSSLHGYTFLHVACQHNRADIVSLLFTTTFNDLAQHGKARGSPSWFCMCLDQRGWTPYHVASYYGATDALAALIQHDKDRTRTMVMPDQQGRTALHYAKCGRTARLLLMLEANTKEATAVQEGSLEIKCRESVADTFLLAADRTGRTALHLACERDCPGVAQSVLVAAARQESRSSCVGRSLLQATTLAGWNAFYLVKSTRVAQILVDACDDFDDGSICSNNNNADATFLLDELLQTSSFQGFGHEEETTANTPSSTIEYCYTPLQLAENKLKGLEARRKSYEDVLSRMQQEHLDEEREKATSERLQRLYCQQESLVKYLHYVVRFAVERVRLKKLVLKDHGVDIHCQSKTTTTKVCPDKQSSLSFPTALLPTIVDRIANRGLPSGADGHSTCSPSVVYYYLRNERI